MRIQRARITPDGIPSCTISFRQVTSNDITVEAHWKGSFVYCAPTFPLTMLGWTECGRCNCPPKLRTRTHANNNVVVPVNGSIQVEELSPADIIYVPIRSCGPVHLLVIRLVI
jgi:hypothetical protein